MRTENEAGTSSEEMPDRREGCLYPGVIRDSSILQGNVEIHPHEDLPAFNLEIADTELGHGITRTAASTE